MNDPLLRKAKSSVLFVCACMFYINKVNTKEDGSEDESERRKSTWKGRRASSGALNFHSSRFPAMSHAPNLVPEGLKRHLMTHGCGGRRYAASASGTPNCQRHTEPSMPPERSEISY